MKSINHVTVLIMQIKMRNAKLTIKLVKFRHLMPSVGVDVQMQESYAQMGV